MGSRERQRQRRMCGEPVNASFSVVFAFFVMVLVVLLLLLLLFLLSLLVLSVVVVVVVVLSGCWWCCRGDVAWTAPSLFKCTESVPVGAESYC